MTDRTNPPIDLDGTLTAWLERTAPDREPEQLLGRILETTSVTRRRPTWWGPGGHVAWLGRPQLLARRSLGVVALVGLLILAIAVALAAGSRPHVPLPLGRSGWIVAAHEGETLLLDRSGRVEHRLSTGGMFGAAAWSPDGSRLARAAGTPDDPVLLITDTDLADVVRVVLPPNTVPWFSWSPDGRRITFGTETETMARVYVVETTARAVPVPITGLAINALAPSWSPDGMWIAFRGGVALDEQALWVMHPDGSALRRLSQQGRAVAPWCGFPWLPDGRSLLFGTAYNGVWVVDVDGTKERQIMGGSEQAYCPSISPDGTRVAAMVWQDTGKYIVVANLDGTHRVTPPAPLYDDWPAVWSPDGRSLVMNGRDLRGGPNPRAFLDPNGVEPARVFFLDDAAVLGWQRLAP
jgi:Tol biopolymer transport system component